MEVVLSKEYTKKLEEQLEAVIDNAINKKIEKLSPYKRYVTRNELCAVLGIGQSTLDKLAMHGLRYAVVGNKHLFDIEEVYSILETLKK